MTRQSLRPSYFDALYAAEDDPWRFATSSYEHAKYEHTMAALPRRRFGAAFEVGCSIGVLTERLAARCERVLAVDVSQRALDLARSRCASQSHVEFARMTVPAEWPERRFDLILFSEVLYYMNQPDIAATARRAVASLHANAFVLLVHWTGETDYPCTADEAVSHFSSETANSLRLVNSERREAYRLDAFATMD